ncbi:hypothetical protein Acsp06_45280 [Actinomycetospora sp. NBRC 106375]|uniref:hypothetical protein n=1 Tax=Actinomycetospora sp. NBRC 106375 TaxID=3032207 RepID=UPI0024A011CE|nr:hypothetical protein [Actinomycetospora sp. NBRC 106375]GLZ48343.1 hypothetical protein Acsp06_45280 [Actinomycetospora sp. NBRC 106375]
MRYHVYLEGEPTLESYRLSHCPREDYAPVFICPFVVLTDAAGGIYNAMRGIQGQNKNETLNMGVYRLDGRLDAQCPVLFPYADNPIAERYRVTESADAVSYVGDTWRYDFGVSDYRWVDGSGRLDLTARRLGQVCTFWVPSQEGYEHPQMLRSHLGKATGTLDGEPVEGLFMLDFIYSRPDAMWSEMGMLTKLHNLWLNWLVEYEDGTYEGGYAWRGRPGTGFAAAHHVADGVSTARSDASVATHFTERGTVHKVDLALGADTSLVLEQYGSTDWPLHTCGTVSSTNRGKKIARSWNYTEFFPLNWSAVADYQVAHHALYGRRPSFARLMRGARVVDQRLVFDQG